MGLRALSGFVVMACVSVHAEYPRNRGSEIAFQRFLAALSHPISGEKGTGTTQLTLVLEYLRPYMSDVLRHTRQTAMHDDTNRSDARLEKALLDLRELSDEWLGSELPTPKPVEVHAPQRYVSRKLLRDSALRGSPTCPEACPLNCTATCLATSPAGRQSDRITYKTAAGTGTWSCSQLMNGRMHLEENEIVSMDDEVVLICAQDITSM